MLAAPTPTFLFERAIDQLAEKIPPDAVALLRTSLRAYRSWVAEPAFRKASPSAAVRHVLESVGPASQLKTEFLRVLASVPDGFELFANFATEELGDAVPLERRASARLVAAVDHMQRAQRMWLRFGAFHPDLTELAAAVGAERLGHALTLAFHADNLLTVCFMATDGQSGGVSRDIEAALCEAAARHAEQWHAAVRALVEQFAPRLDAEAPFRSSTVADLLALPPYDGPAATIEELNDAIGFLFGSS